MNHHCKGFLPESLYGPAIDECSERGGKLYVSNGEYESQVNYCPFCGYEAKGKVPIKP